MRMSGVGIHVHLRQKALPQAKLLQSLHVLSCDTLALEGIVQQALVQNPLLECTRLWQPTLDSFATRGTVPRQELWEVLDEQLSVSSCSPMVRAVCHELIYNVDHRGYLSESLDEMLPSELAPELVAQALALLQGFDPAGVGATSLSECLELQLLRVEHSELELLLIRRYLCELADGVPQIEGYSRAQVAAACKRIRSLSPSPGAAYGNETVSYIIPEVSVTSDEEGRVDIELIHQPSGLSMREDYKLWLGSEDAQQRQLAQDYIRQARDL